MYFSLFRHIQTKITSLAYKEFITEHDSCADAPIFFLSFSGFKESLNCHLVNFRSYKCSNTSPDLFERDFPPSIFIGFPPAVIDAGKGMSAESRRAWIEEKSLILKQTYW